MFKIQVLSLGDRLALLPQLRYYFIMKFFPTPLPCSGNLNALSNGRCLLTQFIHFLKIIPQISIIRTEWNHLPACQINLTKPALQGNVHGIIPNRCPDIDGIISGDIDGILNLRKLLMSVDRMDCSFGIGSDFRVRFYCILAAMISFTLICSFR